MPGQPQTATPEALTRTRRARSSSVPQPRLSRAAETAAEALAAAEAALQAAAIAMTGGDRDGLVTASSAVDGSGSGSGSVEVAVCAFCLLYLGVRMKLTITGAEQRRFCRKCSREDTPVGSKLCTNPLCKELFPPPTPDDYKRCSTCMARLFLKKK